MPVRSASPADTPLRCHKLPVTNDGKGSGWRIASHTVDWRCQIRWTRGAAAMKILGLSGSLRAASVNSMLLRAIARLAPVDINVSIFTELGELPLFNPDLEACLPVSVVAFHRAVAAADTVLFASPE